MVLVPGAVAGAKHCNLVEIMHELLQLLIGPEVSVVMLLCDKILQTVGGIQRNPPPHVNCLCLLAICKHTDTMPKDT